MQEIPFLSSENFDHIFNKIDLNNTSEFISVISDLINHAPFASEITSDFISKCIYKNPTIQEDILKILSEKPENSEIATNKAIYGAYLGAKTQISIITPISSIFSNISLDSNKIDNFNILQEYYCHSIISELHLCRKECILRLKAIPLDILLEYFVKNQTLINISFLIQMCNDFSFFQKFEKRHLEFKMKNEIIASIFTTIYCIFEVFNNPDEFEEDFSILRRIIVNDTYDYCLKACNTYYLGLLFNKRIDEPYFSKITLNDFNSMKFSSSSEFFDAFLKLTSPSVSHFFSYLQFFKDKFNLNENDKNLFIEKIKEFHSNNPAYLQIVLERVPKFLKN